MLRDANFYRCAAWMAHRLAAQREAAWLASLRGAVAGSASRG